MTAFETLREKLAGRDDYRKTDKLVDPLTRGSPMSFIPRGGDHFQQGGLREGLGYSFISGPIQLGQGSPVSHTAVYDGRAPDGTPMLIHTYEQGGEKAFRREPVHKYIDTRTMLGHRLPWSEDIGNQIADEMNRALAEENHYSKRNLAAAGLSTLGERTRLPVFNRLSAMIAEKNCNPGTGICSTVPVQAAGRVVGLPAAVDVFSGGRANVNNWEHTVTPKMISESLPIVSVLGSGLDNPEEAARFLKLNPIQRRLMLLGKKIGRG